MSNNQQSFYLKSGDEHIACTAVIPEKISGAVLMLLPFVEERKGSLPLLLQIARKLYRNNVASLIFDWRGSGDSSGEFENIDPADFNTDIKTALTWLKKNTGEVPITALGIRLSASFLLQLNNPDVENLVLISPASGDEFIRQLLQRRMVNDMVAYGKAIESRASLLEKLKSGKSVDLDGYIFSASFYSWTEKITIPNSQHGTSNIQGENADIRDTGYEIGDNKSERPTSVSAKASTDKSNKTNCHSSSLTTCHSPLATLLIPGGHSPKTAKKIADKLDNVEMAELRFPPFWNTVGHVDLCELIESVSSWICQTHTAHREVRPPIYDIDRSEAREGETPFEPLTISDMQLADITAADSTIRSAIDSPWSTPKAGILFLPGWSGDRSGPHRIFVQLARKLVQEGYLCMRPDFRGRGLSDGKHEEASIASMAEDADAALAELKRQLPDSAPVYIAAICSGCKVAITLAADHPEIAKMLLLSAESMGSLRSEKTDSNKTKKALKTYLKKLTQPETWKKIVTGKVQTKMVTKALVKHETRSDDEATTEDQTLKKFQVFTNPIHFVFGGSDPDAPGSMASYKTYCENHSIPHSMHLVPNAGHSYYSEKWTDEVLETGIDFLTRTNS